MTDADLNSLFASTPPAAKRSGATSQLTTRLVSGDFPSFATGLFLAVGGMAVATQVLVRVIADRATAVGRANAVYSFALFSGAVSGSPLAGVLAATAHRPSPFWQPAR